MDKTLILAIVGIILASLGILATVFVAWLVDKRTKRLLSHIESIQIADMPPQKYRTLLKLIEDMERSGMKRGTLNQRPDGSWGIDYILEMKG